MCLWTQGVGEEGPSALSLCIRTPLTEVCVPICVSLLMRSELAQT